MVIVFRQPPFGFLGIKVHHDLFPLEFLVRSLKQVEEKVGVYQNK